MSSTTGMFAIANPRIAVTRRIPEPALELLRETADVWVSPHDRPLDTDELHRAIAGADAAGPQLRCVANVAVGYDNIDARAAAHRGVIVTNTPGVLTDATADLAMAL